MLLDNGYDDNKSYSNSGITVTMTELIDGGFYGQDMTSGGQATFVFSSTVGNIKGITITATQVYYFNNDWNKGNNTLTWSGTPASSVTLSSDPITICGISSIVFTIESPTVAVTLTGGANATPSGGNTTQSGLAGAMTTVTYTANANYKFPETSDYYKTTNGITVTRTSNTVVTVSGTPTADANITVPDAVEKTSINQTVTFKVVNGSWDDGTTTDKTVTLTGYEGDTLKLAASQIPAVGSKPNDTYKSGSWNVTPSADTAITAATTYTYTYAKKESAVVPDPDTPSSSDDETYSFVPDGTKDSDVSTAKDPPISGEKTAVTLCCSLSRAYPMMTRPLENSMAACE